MTSQPPPPQQQFVQPQPSAESWVIEQVPMSDGQVMIRIQIFSVSGRHESFMNAEAAAQIGAQLAGAGQHLRTGLILPGGAVRLPPPPGPNGTQP